MKKFYFFTIWLVLTATISFSQPGTLDASFGVGGKVVTTVGDSSSVANAVVVTPNGKIIVGGQSFIAGQSQATLLQYNNDGTIDSTFGSAGKVFLSLPSSNGRIAINRIALQPDGKIVAVGYYSSYIEPLIARFKPDGSLDSTFGTNGIAPAIIVDPEITFGGIASKVVIKPDGKIVVGGTALRMDFGDFPFILQYLPNGTIDSSFGTNGGTAVGIGAPYVTVDKINDIAITADSKIITAINEYNTVGIFGQPEFQLDRLLPNGMYDSSFGIDGVVRTSNDSMWRGGDAYGVVVLPDSSVVATGYLATSTQLLLTLLKYHPNGTPDSLFGSNGKAATAITGYISDPKRILLLPDGKLLVTGYTYPSRDFLVVKFLPDGRLDSSFGINGITITDFSGTDDLSYSSTVQPDGKIVLAGSTGNNVNYNIALARYNNDIILPLYLLSFTVRRNENINLLQWQTAQETDASTFEVQRSGNSKDYVAIGYVNVGSNSYHFTDHEPLSGNNYYRLKMIDKNGNFTYSPVRRINNKNLFAIKTYPNPAKDKLQVQIDNSKELVLQWQILSADGKVLMANQWSLQADGSVKDINIAALSKGNYYLIVTAGNKEQRLIKFEKL